MRTNLRVSGYPPAKSEARSMLGPSHPHRDRVMSLLQVAHDALRADDAEDIGHAPLVLHVELRCPHDRLRSDATNYLGGITDVLQNKRAHGALIAHLGELARVQLFEDDAQVEEIHFWWEDAAEPEYDIYLERRDA